MNKGILIIIVNVFLLGCADSASRITIDKADIISKKKTSNLKYTCARGAKLSVNFTTTNNGSDKNIAIINDYGKQAIILPNKEVTSGFLYSNGKYTLRGDGNQATWTVGRMAPFQCSIGDKFIHQDNIK